MSCDGTTEDPLVLGDVWHWVYDNPTDDDGETVDISDWSDLLVVITELDGTVLASSAPTGDQAEIHTDGGFEGEIAATDFDAGRLAWWVDSMDLTTTASALRVEAEVLIGGVATTVYPARTYEVSKDRAVREVGS